jgi:hypothetical protein
LIQNNKFLFFRNYEYYAVPDVFGNKKEQAVIFEECLKKTGGKYRLVYTRNADGRKLLLKARTKAFVNRNDELLNINHKIKSKWE